MRKQAIILNHIYIFSLYHNMNQIDRQKSNIAQNEEDLDLHEQKASIQSSPHQFVTSFGSVNQSFFNETNHLKQNKNHLIKVLILIIIALLLVATFYSEKLINEEINRSQFNPIILENRYPKDMQKILWLKSYAQMIRKKKKQINNQNTIESKQKSFSQYAQQLMSQIKDAHPYIEINQYVNQRLQLPFCMIVNERNKQQQNKIISSIMSNYYGNYVVIASNEKNKSKQPQNENIKRVVLEKRNYFEYKSLIAKLCLPNSLIFFVNHPIQQHALKYFNNIHQSYNTWLTYSNEKNVLQIYTFYQRIFDLLQNNDFQNSNSMYLKVDDKQIQAISLLELSMLHLKQVNREDIFNQYGKYSYYLVNKNNDKIYKRTPYSALPRLSQDFKIDLDQDRQNYKFMLKESIRQRQNIRDVLNLNKNKMMMAIQLQDLIYLPKNHSLSVRQLKYFDRMYQTQQFNKEQLPLCITVLSHNNLQNNRHVKNFLSIFQQQYTNYHIVFIDDMSDDDTFQKTKQFVENYGFDMNRIVFVKNKYRKFATFNILNAAFNYCNTDDIQILVDGDDEIIGRHVFSLLNGIYQKDKKWVVYTNLKTNFYKFGTSKPVRTRQTILTQDNKRGKGHFLGQLRSWKIRLIRRIPKKYHQDRDGAWLDTLYDDALQHPFFELSTVEKVSYVPQICYEYNKEYGDNDDSDNQKIYYRNKMYEYIVSLPPLSPLKSLQEAASDQQVPNLLKSSLPNQLNI